MDIYQIISQLSLERDRIILIIESLEGLKSPAKAAGTGRRRGRKSMDAGARGEVSERMKLYWAKRHAAERQEQPAPIKSTAASA